MKYSSKIALLIAATISASYATPSFAGTDIATPVAASASKTLLPGDSFVSPDGRFKLTFQADGNFVLYQGSTVLWDINSVIGIPTNGYVAWRTTFQTDGNLVVYWRQGVFNEQAVWDANTQGHSSATLAVQNDGNVVIYDGNHVAIWDTNTCCH